MFCTYCGSPLHEDDRFCDHCGNAVPASANVDDAHNVDADRPAHGTDATITSALSPVTENSAHTTMALPTIVEDDTDVTSVLPNVDADVAHTDVFPEDDATSTLTPAVSKDTDDDTEIPPDALNDNENNADITTVLPNAAIPPAAPIAIESTGVIPPADVISSKRYIDDRDRNTTIPKSFHARHAAPVIPNADEPSDDEAMLEVADGNASSPVEEEPTPLASSVDDDDTGIDVLVGPYPNDPQSEADETELSTDEAPNESSSDNADNEDADKDGQDTEDKDTDDADTENENTDDTNDVNDTDETDEASDEASSEEDKPAPRKPKRSIGKIVALCGAAAMVALIAIAVVMLNNPQSSTIVAYGANKPLVVYPDSRIILYGEDNQPLQEYDLELRAENGETITFHISGDRGFTLYELGLPSSGIYTGTIIDDTGKVRFLPPLDYHAESNTSSQGATNDSSTPKNNTETYIPESFTIKPAESPTIEADSYPAIEWEESDVITDTDQSTSQDLATLPDTQSSGDLQATIDNQNTDDQSSQSQSNADATYNSDSSQDSSDTSNATPSQPNVDQQENSIAPLPEMSTSVIDPVLFESVEATSVLPGDGAITYDAANVADGDTTTAWTENGDNVGLGESITFSSPTPQTIGGMIIYNGYQENEGVYSSNTRPQELKIYANDTYIATIKLEDKGLVPQQIAFSEPIIASKITLEIFSVYEGAQYPNTSISEVIFY